MNQTLSWLKWETVYEFASMARADPIMIVASCILQIVWKVDTECCDMEGYVGQIGIPAADRQLARFPGFPCPGVAAIFIHPAKHLGKLSGTLHPLLFCWLEIVGQTAALSEGEVCTIPGKWGAPFCTRPVQQYEIVFLLWQEYVKCTTIYKNGTLCGVFKCAKLR